MSDLLQVVAERIEDQAKRDTESIIEMLDGQLAECIDLSLRGSVDKEMWRAFDAHIKAICSLVEPMLLERTRKRMEQTVVSNMLATPKEPFFGHL